jgi:hypothetical protein
MKTPHHILTKNFLAIPRKYFDSVIHPKLTTATSHQQPLAITYKIAGKNIQVLYYGNTTDPVFSYALGHHPQTTDAPDVTIHAFDSQALGSVIPAPWDDPDFEMIEHYHDKDFFGIYVGGEESLNFYNPKTKTGYFWVHDASRMPDWSLGAPFRTILHWFLHQ